MLTKRIASCSFSQPSAHFAELYRTNKLHGGHVIKLGPNNDQAAREALKAWPKGLQLGGSVNESNAQAWLDEGAEKVQISIGTRRCWPKADDCPFPFRVFGNPTCTGHRHIVPIPIRQIRA